MEPGPTPQLSVVIPAFNEEQRLRRTLPVVIDWLRRRFPAPGSGGVERVSSAPPDPTERPEPLEPFGPDWEVLVVDDGSTDGTAPLVRDLAKDQPGLRLLSFPRNRGKGAVVRDGCLDASGALVLFSDADLSTPIEDLDRLLPRIEAGYGLVCGSRAAPGAQVEHNQVWYRNLAGRLFGLGTRMLVVRGIADTQCGFKCMTREVAQRVLPQLSTDSAIFDVEMLLVATREGVHVAEVPVRWRHDPDTRIPYDLRRAVGIWLELFRIRRAHRVVWPVRALTQAPPTRGGTPRGGSGG